MNILQSFIKDLKDSLPSKRNVDIGVGLFDYLYKEASFDNTRYWVKATPKANALNTGICGTVISGNRDHKIDRPSCIRKVGNEFWVSSMYRTIARFDSNFSFLGYWRGFWASPSDFPNSYYFVRSFCVDEEKDRIYIAMEWRNMVRCFRLSTGDFLWQYGDGVAGDVVDGRLSRPMDVELLPNGNIIICSYEGKGHNPDSNIQSLDNGHISEINAQTGAFVKSHLMHITRGDGWLGEVSNPVRARVLGDGLLYVSSYGKHHISSYDIDTWQQVKTYTNSAGGVYYPRGISLDADKSTLAVVCNGPKMVVGLGVLDCDYKWCSGKSEWDDRPTSRDNIGAFNDIWDILPFKDNLYLVTDYGNNRVQVIPSTNSIEVAYEANIPEGYKVVYKPDNYDLSSHTLTIANIKASELGDVYLILER